jgi:hypothetical protein
LVLNVVVVVVVVWRVCQLCGESVLCEWHGNRVKSGGSKTAGLFGQNQKPQKKKVWYIRRSGPLSSSILCDLVNDIFVTAYIGLVRIPIMEPIVWILLGWFLTETSWHWIVIRRSCNVQFSSISIADTVMNVIGMHGKVFGSNGSFEW